MKMTSSLIALCLMIDIVLLVYPVNSHWFWGRRRRRVPPPPPVINCRYTSWSSWTTCSTYCGATGSQERKRGIATPASGGGSCNGPFQQKQSCTIRNSCRGPSVRCDVSNGRCSCTNPGYYLDGNTCKDRNECTPNSGKGPCDQICSNTAGSYQCSCNNGYSLSPPHSCQPKNCGSLTTLTCPSNSYVDSFSPACKKVSVSCPSGTTFQKSCSLSCSSSYKVGKISPQNGKKFGQDYTQVDFKTAKTSATCSLKGSGVAWDISSHLSSYFCRRVNDPPLDITLSSNKLPEHSSSGYTIGKLISTDMQQGQSFTYTVEKNAMLFTCQGDELKSIWKDPDLQGSIPLNNGAIDITIRSKDNGKPLMWFDKTFTIKIIDVNDPPFNITLSNNKILENATIGEVIGVFRAMDKDDPPGTPASSNFAWSLISNSNGVFGLQGAKLIVNKKLDHESAKIHQITVSCTDKGTPPKTSLQNFVININDVNELPVSLQLSSTSIPENAGIGSVVGELTASDDDNDQITFSMAQSSNLTLSTFSLSNSSCSFVSRVVTCKSFLLVKGNLDYEETPSYPVVIIANDKSGQIVQKWKITVANINEKPTGISLSGTHRVSENSPKGTTVGTFLVADPDNKNSMIQTHSCIFLSGDVDYFSIESNDILKVSGVKTLDFESKNKLSITVKCIDDGKDPANLFVIQSFNITVTDVNEPPISLKLSKLKVAENSPVNTPVGNLSFSDPENAYQSYTFTIQGPQGTPFKLGGPGNDQVLVGGSVDYEKTKNLQLTVRVADSGGLFAEKTFTINVLDVNEPPKGILLPGQNNLLTIQEETIGFYISTIKLDDEDSTDKDPTDCALIDDAQQRVNLLKSSWVLKSGPKKTDFETSLGFLSITLNCSDSHGRFVWQSFNITITNINEKPTDIQLSNNSVQENQKDAYIGTVTVTDPDMGQSHQCVVCEVTQEGCIVKQSLQVDSAMELNTIQPLDFEARKVYSIKITCTDQPPPQGSSLSVEKDFTVHVIDVNEAPASLCTSPITLSKHESNGAIITPLNAVDPDNERTKKQQLSYAMDNSLYNGIFQLKENHIFKNKEISSAQTFTLPITVTDDGRIVGKDGGFIITNPKMAVFKCNVTVTDAQPSNDIQLSSNTVPLMAPKGSTVGTLSTTGGPQGEVYEYKLLNSEYQPFGVDGNKLIVSLSDVPHEAISSPNTKELLQDITIQSTDSKNRVLTKRMILIINDNAPRIKMCLVKHSIQENKPANSIVGQILIEDPVKYQCSKTKCCSQIVGQIPANSFKYHCQVNNPDSNAVIVPKNNVTALFDVDDQYMLRSKVRFNYQDYLDSKGEIQVGVSCHDLVRPLHMLWKTIAVNILDCDANNNCPYPSECVYCNNGGTCLDNDQSHSCSCAPGYTGQRCDVEIDYCQANLCQHGSTCENMKTSFKCVCLPNYYGVLCNKNEELCKKCKDDTLCVKFVKAAKRCLSTEHQVPILDSKPSLSAMELINIENEISKLAEENINKKDAVSSRKKRSSKSRFYVETLKQESLKDGTLLYLAILDSTNGYEPLMSTKACALLKDTNRHCIDQKDCNTITSSGRQCPVIGKPKANASTRTDDSSSDGVNIGIGVLSVVIFIAVVAICGVFYYRRKASKAKASDDHNAVYNPNQESVDFHNPVYGTGNVNNSMAVQDMVNDRLGKEDLVHANLDPNSVRKRNDIKVTENALYVPPCGPVLSSENPSYMSANAAARIPKLNNTEDKKHVNIDTKTEKVFSESKDGVYQDIPDMKKEDAACGLETEKPLSVPLGDNPYEDVDPKTGKAFSVSLRSENMYEDVAYLKGKKENDCVKGADGDEKPQRKLQERHKSRYEQNPVVVFPKKKNNDQHNEAISNHLYEMQPTADKAHEQRQHIYENVVKTQDKEDKDFEISELVQQYEDVGDNSIINPLYDMADPSGQDDDQEPLYEDIPAMKLPEKTKKKHYRKSLSLEKASGYEELDEDKGNGCEDVFRDSSA